MSARRLPRWIARRATVRLRLTALYSALLLASGGLLLGITYTLVRNNISSAGAPPITKSAVSREQIEQCKKSLTLPPKQPSLKAPTSGDLIAQCRKLLATAAQAGASAQRTSTLNHLVLYWVLALAALTLLSALAGWWLAGRALRPVAAITSAARRAAAGDLSGRLALAGPPDELHRLAATFDEMLDRLQSVFESQRQFIANASHELRTPLAVMRTALEVTLAKPTRGEAEIARMTTDIERAVSRSEALVDALLALARSEQPASTAEPLDLATLSEDALDEASPAIRARDLTLEPDLQHAPAHGDAVLLSRMIDNLVTNAIRHNDSRGWIRVATATNNGVSSFTIENTGPTVRADEIPQLFRPFKRARDRTAADGGLGLGLAIAKAVARSHQGTLDATPRADGGLTVEARIPVAPPPEA